RVGGGRPRRDRRQVAQAPVHAGALLGGAALASGRAARRDHPGRRGTEPAGAAGRLPLPPTLSPRAPALLERGAEAPVRVGSPGRLPPVPEVRLSAWTTSRSTRSRSPMRSRRSRAIDA